MTVVTRFAPSPTGYLHIGGARTALFNYLFAKHHNGKFYLRIEDTDIVRSTPEAVDAIIDGLKWLEINWDDEVIYQFARAERHKQVAKELVAMGQAYYCYTTQEELAKIRETKGHKFTSIWRDRDQTLAPIDAEPVIRLKSPETGDTIIKDLIQGDVVISNSQIDDMVLLRADGTPTYMLAVVVDDHDMGVTHIIRGDDHLNNAARQIHIYNAMNWHIPEFAHIPLIHGEDGAKLSKRHGALGVDAYRDMGYLSETLANYLVRLGWAHGNAEVISRKQAVEWFDLASIGKSPSRLDFKKLDNLNQIYIKETDNKELVDLVLPFIGRDIDLESYMRLEKAMNGLKPRAKNLVELAGNCQIYLTDFVCNYTEDAVDLPQDVIKLLQHQEIWAEEEIKDIIKQYCINHDIKLGDLAQIIRIKLTGSKVSPSVFEIMHIIGKKETMCRLET